MTSPFTNNVSVGVEEFGGSLDLHKRPLDERDSKPVTAYDIIYSTVILHDVTVTVIR